MSKETVIEEAQIRADKERVSFVVYPVSNGEEVQWKYTYLRDCHERMKFNDWQNAHLKSIHPNLLAIEKIYTKKIRRESRGANIPYY